MIKKMLGACVGLALICAASTASAGFLHTWDLATPGPYTTAGIIDFGSAAGTGSPAGLSAFSVSGSHFGTPYFFDLDDVVSASWTLDPTDWSISDISLIAFNSSAVVERFEIMNASVSLPGVQDFRTFDFGGAQVFAGVFGTTVSVPEPATLTLFGFGLAGLGFAMRRRRRA